MSGASSISGQWRVVIALGSNVPHGRFGPPARVLDAAVAALAAAGLQVERRARTRMTDPIGPSSRRYANSAVLGRWEGTLAGLLAACQAIERAFGRRRGRRWGARVLDLDLLVADGAVARSRALTLPHPRLAERRFALDPLVDVWPGWRHPLGGLTPRRMRGRLMKPRRAASGGGGVGS